MVRVVHVAWCEQAADNYISYDTVHWRKYASPNCSWWKALIVNRYCLWVTLFIHRDFKNKINKIRSFTGQGTGAWAE